MQNHIHQHVMLTSTKISKNVNQNCIVIRRRKNVKRRRIGVSQIEVFLRKSIQNLPICLTLQGAITRANLSLKASFMGHIFARCIEGWY